jgi:hypothetical protein
MAEQTEVLIGYSSFPGEKKLQGSIDSCAAGAPARDG